MKKLLSILAATALLIAQPASAADPCGAVLCLSTISSVPSQCGPHINDYFSIRVYIKKKKKKIFVPDATAAKRLSEILEKCDGAPPDDVARITATYGPLEHSPFSFYNVAETKIPSADDNDEKSTDSGSSKASSGTTADISDYLLTKPFGNTKEELDAEYAEIYNLWAKAAPIAKASQDALNSCYAAKGYGGCNGLLTDNIEKSGLEAAYRFRLDRIKVEMSRLP